jgi:hypothetical protein
MSMDMGVKPAKSSTGGGATGSSNDNGRISVASDDCSGKLSNARSNAAASGKRSAGSFASSLRNTSW